MEQTLEQRIRERAYALWLAHGSAEGNAEQYWLEAEREVLAMLTAQPSASEAVAERKQSKRRAAPATDAKPRARASAR